MAKLEVNIDKFIQETIEEMTTKSWMENPELELKHHPGKELESLKIWYRLRKDQINSAKIMDLTTLDNARNNGYLNLRNYFQAKDKLESAYKTIMEKSRHVYDKEKERFAESNPTDQIK